MNAAFQLIVLGFSGGPHESNLSGYLLAPLHSTSFIALDGGTLLEGIEKALQKNSFPEISFTGSGLLPAGVIYRNHVKAYLISHPHLDHISGMVINSQADVPKIIMGTDPTIDHLRDHIFNGIIWPNYGSEGLGIPLNLYRYMRVPLRRAAEIPNTEMQVEMHPLSHPGAYSSTAFLVSHQGHYLLYCGDTSPDSLEEEKHLRALWERVIPLIKNKQLHAIMLECSYPARHIDEPYYGHLNSSFMIQELQELAKLAGGDINGLTMIAIHPKESLQAGEHLQKEIANELTEKNEWGFRFIFPEQGERITV